MSGAHGVMGDGALTLSWVQISNYLPKHWQSRRELGYDGKGSRLWLAHGLALCMSEQGNYGPKLRMLVLLVYEVCQDLDEVKQ